MSKDMTSTLEQAAQSSEIMTRMLVTIYAPDNVFRFVANDNTDLTFNGDIYTAAQISRGEIKTSTDGDKEQVKLEMSNKWQQWAAYLANNGNKLNGCRCVIQEVFLDYLSEGPVWLFEGVLNSIRMTISNFECTVERDTVDFEAESPALTYDPNCQWRRFKDERCRYSGTETTCDKTLTRCIELGNVLNFGGHPSVPREMVIK